MPLLLARLLAVLFAAVGCPDTPADREASFCDQPLTIDTSGWQPVEVEGLRFVLPPDFRRDPDREAEFIHGGLAWVGASRSFEILPGHWGDTSIPEADEQCVLDISGHPLHVSVYSQPDHFGLIAWHAATDGSIYGRLFGGRGTSLSDQQDYLVVLRSLEIRD